MREKHTDPPTLQAEQPAGSSQVFDQMASHDHEIIAFCQDTPTGLRAIIAVHDTTLGPALGGCRMWPYATEAEALEDVLRLSRGMTYKAAVAGLDLGGGKAVILSDPYEEKSDALLRRFGQFVNTLSGKYITAEDVGISPEDIVQVNRETEYVACLPESHGGGGDPSPVTAYGVYLGMKACAKLAYGSESLKGKTVLVQGVGHVGSYLVQHLVKENARVKIADIYQKAIAETAREHDVEVIRPGDVYQEDMDIYAPCALGATVNPQTLSRLTCDIIAGGANNQLASEERDGLTVMKRDILYAPDFVINAGGLINCYTEKMQGYDRKRALARTELIHDRVLDILEQSREDQIPSYLAANRLAMQRIAEVGRLRQTA